MTWSEFAMNAILLVTVVIEAAALMHVWSDLAEKRRSRIIAQVAKEMTERYLPGLAEAEIEMTERIMDKICDKIPDMMEKTTESMKKVMDE